jgi:hypothetical protein
MLGFDRDDRPDVKVDKLEQVLQTTSLPLGEWEDIHWGDSSTLETLGLVLEHTPTVLVRNLLTFRLEFPPVAVYAAEIHRLQGALLLQQAVPNPSR